MTTAALSHPMYRLVANALDRAQTEATPVYVVSVDGKFAKVGCSMNVKRRIATIQSHSPFPIHLLGWTVGGGPVERAIHRKFAHLRTHGEWFLLTDEITDWAASDLSQGPAPRIKHHSYGKLATFEDVQSFIERYNARATAERAA